MMVVQKDFFFNFFVKITHFIDNILSIKILFEINSLFEKTISSKHYVQKDKCIASQQLLILWQPVCVPFQIFLLKLLEL